MNNFRKIFLLSVLAVIALTAQPIQAAAQPVTIIDNIYILPMTGEGIQEGKALLIKDGVISEIIPKEAIHNYPGAEIIDGKNGYLIPGLVDSHIHYRTEEEFLNYIYFGVTSVIGLGQGKSSLEKMKAKREAINTGAALGPKIFTAGHTIANHIKFTNPDEAAAYVKSLKDDNLDFVKVYNNISMEVFDAVVKEAGNQDLAVFGHLPRTFPVEYALANGLDVIAHSEEFYFAYFGGIRDQNLDNLKPSNTPDLSLVNPILDLLKTNDVALIPNLIFTFEVMKFWDDTNSLLAEPEIKFLHPDLRTMWANSNSVSPRRKNVRKRILRERLKYSFIHEFTRRAHEKGILLVAGTDAPLPGLYPGKSLHSELREFVKAGLDYYQVLQTATANASEFIQKYIDKNTYVGLIKPGYEADLVLVRENPLEDIRNLEKIEGVMVDGTWRSKENLEDLRAAMVEGFPKTN